MDKLNIDGAWVFNPEIHRDRRGAFLEWFRNVDIGWNVGRQMRLAQANFSVSGLGVIRGIHFADVPPGQAKYVTCVQGAVFDVVIDLRVGSPTYGCWDSVRLDDVHRKGVYIAEGLGHAFMSLSQQSTLVYLCSEEYSPHREHRVNPVDPGCGIDWPAEVTPILSANDETAPGLEERHRAGLLPSYDRCLEQYASLGGARH